MLSVLSTRVTTSYVTHTIPPPPPPPPPPIPTVDLLLQRGGGRGWGEHAERGRRDIQLLDVLEKFDNHSNYLTWGWHWSTVRPFYSCIIPLSPWSRLAYFTFLAGLTGPPGSIQLVYVEHFSGCFTLPLLLPPSLAPSLVHSLL